MKALFIIALLLFLSACAPVPVTPAASPVVTVRCSYPVITPLPQTKELQTKGGINISLAPNDFTCKDAVRKTTRNIAQTLFDMNEISSKVDTANREGGKPDDYRLTEVTSTPVYGVSPEKVAFRVKINNQMPRVFRGSGTVVLYNFGGRNNSISSQEYAELTNLIVPPRTEAEVTIYGPAFTSIPEKTTLGIFLYDVVTKTDTAGNIQEKQNFEWYYSYELRTKEAQREVKKEKIWVRK